VCFRVCGGTAASKRMEGPAGAELENKEERRGKMKRRIRGRSEVRMEEADWGVSLSPAAGLRRGLPPPNWCTRTPGPPPRLKTKPGPVSKPVEAY